MKPKYCLIGAVIAAILGLISWLLAAPYYTLPWQHHAAIFLVLIMVGICLPVVIMLSSDGPNYWSKPDGTSSDEPQI